ncbi:protein-disulfide reductase DsbD family protein [Planctomicrobium piriforme]|uniref:Thiol:disulfide interchange protein n=1 Tax=Planctomicrobium piriforme TaxID=1576369 RepID=A0A1I3BAX6_9PLAN|nr:protein-disulfide reductase DsbD domain-containing protein [Planctomicrobium piriforme]SFH59453.1 Thiol:disulfide interchange protein [Planctomicrobium piriforme]
MRCVIASFLTLFLLAQTAGAQGLGGDLFQLEEPAAQGAAPKADVTATLIPTGQPGVVELQVKFVLPTGANTYSQDPNFPKPTKITLGSADWTPIDSAFTITPPPKKEHDENFDMVVEKVFGTVVFSRKYALPAGVDAKSATVSGKVNFLLCNKSLCSPQTAEFTANVAPVKTRQDQDVSQQAPAKTEPPVVAPAAAAPFRTAQIQWQSAPNVVAPSAVTSAPPLTNGYEITPQRKSRVGAGASDPIRLQFELSPAEAKPGEIVTVAITMTLSEGWSTYALTPADDTQVESPTVIKLTPTNLKAVGEMVSVPPPEVHTTKLQDEVHRSNAYEHLVTWKQAFEVVDAAPIGVTGTIRYQICESGKSCLAPTSVSFSLGSVQNAEQLVGATPIVTPYVNVKDDGGTTPPTTPAEVAEATNFNIETAGGDMTLAGAMFAAFFAGLIMNVLPCVLPVLAIKILSLVQQAGESRARTIALNFAYTAGVMAVFMVFALLSFGLGQSLSAVFQNTTFMIVMTCVVFTMGLSLFGVFELPVPGIIPSAGHHQEGYFGAFNTGIIATLLGTPCIGPFVAPVFTWSLSQPAAVVFAMFGLMGLGMASPFLLTGFFPALVNWVPRPGNWMVKFKQFTGFVLMGTVIWLLVSIEMEWRVPVLVLLLALGLFVWLCANLTSPADHLKKQLRGYAASFVAALPVFVFGLWMMQEFRPAGSSELQISKMPWQPFSEEQLVKLRTEGRPMLIDFTANWCVICKINEKIALDRDDTVNFVKENGFVPMLADFTKENPEILKYLRQFGQDSVPLTIIIPPGKDSKIIALRGQYTQSILLEKLQEAMGTTTAQDKPDTKTKESEAAATPKITPQPAAALGIAH